MSISSMLQDTCNIYTITETQDSFGEIVKTEVLKYSDLKCRIVEGGIAEIVEDGLLRTSKKPYKCYFMPENDIERLDVIEWNSLKLRVLSAKKDSSYNHYELQAELIEG